MIDQGWLPLSRQVGKSGMTVKPRVYLAFGISGAPEHWEGMQNSQCIIAVNTDPKAPIFDGAHYGVVRRRAGAAPRADREDQGAQGMSAAMDPVKITVLGLPGIAAAVGADRWWRSASSATGSGS